MITVTTLIVLLLQFITLMGSGVVFSAITRKNQKCRDVMFGRLYGAVGFWIPVVAHLFLGTGFAWWVPLVALGSGFCVSALTGTSVSLTRAFRSGVFDIPS